MKLGNIIAYIMFCGLAWEIFFGDPAYRLRRALAISGLILLGVIFGLLSQRYPKFDEMMQSYFSIYR